MDTLSAFKEFSVERMSNAKEAVVPSKNQSVLDGLGEDSDGNLTYKGEPIAATKPSLPPVDATIDWSEAVITAEERTMVFETSMLPENARVTKIEIPDVVSGAEDYIPLEDMVSRDPSGAAFPYFIMYPKNAQGMFLPTVAAIVTFAIAPNDFMGLVQAFGFDGKTIKIYYEIEE